MISENPHGSCHGSLHKCRIFCNNVVFMNIFFIVDTDNFELKLKVDS